VALAALAGRAIYQVAGGPHGRLHSTPSLNIKASDIHDTAQLIPIVSRAELLHIYVLAWAFFSYGFLVSGARNTRISGRLGLKVVACGSASHVRCLKKQDTAAGESKNRSRGRPAHTSVVILAYLPGRSRVRAASTGSWRWVGYKAPSSPSLGHVPSGLQTQPRRERRDGSKNDWSLYFWWPGRRSWRL
jgi:hypothetical protein